MLLCGGWWRSWFHANMKMRFSQDIAIILSTFSSMNTAQTWVGGLGELMTSVVNVQQHASCLWDCCYDCANGCVGGGGCCFFLGQYNFSFSRVNLHLELYRLYCVLCYLAQGKRSACLKCFTLSADALSSCFRAFVTACGYVHLWPLVSPYNTHFVSCIWPHMGLGGVMKFVVLWKQNDDLQWMINDLMGAHQDHVMLTCTRRSCRANKHTQFM